MTDSRSAISDLVYTYAERIDLGDFDGLADLFAHAVVIGGEDFVRRGRDEVLAMAPAAEDGRFRVPKILGDAP